MCVRSITVTPEPVARIEAHRSDPHSADDDADSHSDSDLTLPASSAPSSAPSSAVRSKIYPPAPMNRRNSRSMMNLPLPSDLLGHDRSFGSSCGGGDGSDSERSSSRVRFLAKPYKRLLNMLAGRDKCGERAGSESDISATAKTKSKTKKKLAMFASYK